MTELYWQRRQREREELELEVEEEQKEMKRKKDEENVLMVDKILEMHKKNKFKIEKIPTAYVSLKYENVKAWTDFIF